MAPRQPNKTEPNRCAHFGVDTSSPEFVAAVASPLHTEPRYTSLIEGDENECAAAAEVAGGNEKRAPPIQLHWETSTNQPTTSDAELAAYHTARAERKARANPFTKLARAKADAKKNKKEVGGVDDSTYTI